MLTRASSPALVLVTAPDLKVARRLSQMALRARLIACANLVPRIESHYWWQGQLETRSEVLILMKTTNARLAALEKLILANHPYDTPEFVVLSLTKGTKKYLDWVKDSASLERPAKGQSLNPAGQAGVFRAR